MSFISGMEYMGTVDCQGSRRPAGGSVGYHAAQIPAKASRMNLVGSSPDESMGRDMEGKDGFTELFP